MEDKTTAGTKDERTEGIVPAAAIKSNNDDAIQSSDNQDEIIEAKESNTDKDPAAETDDESDEGDEDNNVNENITLDEDEANFEEDDDDDPSLLHYTRLANLDNAIKCTCSVMGKVVLNTDTLDEATLAASNMNSNSNNNGSNSNININNNNSNNIGSKNDNTRNLESPWLWSQHQFSILALGFSDGSIRIYDLQANVMIKMWKIRDNLQIVAVSIDASGTHIAAIDSGGMCHIWEAKYTLQVVQGNNATEANSRMSFASPVNGLSNFFSAFTKAPQAGNDSTTNQNATQEASSETDSSKRTCLKISSTQLQKLPYPSSFKQPTCIVLDPAYKYRREKSVVVGFADGRLVLTKRGFFSRRSEVILYQTAVGNEDGPAILDIAWRGNYLAFADATGIRFLDAVQWTRIVHVDRPSGARPMLYPTLQPIKPTLVFETSTSLLVAWGDCLLSLRIHEKTVRVTPNAAPNNNTGSDASDAVNNNPIPTVIRKRTVECNMAWELDCVACGVVPLDAQHVAVLGLSSNGDEHHDIEVQVVSRNDGAVVYSDILPLQPAPQRGGFLNRGGGGKDTVYSAASLMFRSSFAVPRMDNALESERGGLVEETATPSSLFSPPEVKKAFRDPHLTWRLDSVDYSGDIDGMQGKDTDNQDDDNASVDSENYSFVFDDDWKERSDRTADDIPPPLMFVGSGFDAVVTRMCTIDDAVSHSLERGKPASALKQALCNLRYMRRHKLENLVDAYLSTILRLDNQSKSLSLRRMKLAADAMPILLGGNTSSWQRWITELSKIPGALFVVRKVIPVRDPQLPWDVYTKTVVAMYSQVKDIVQFPNHVSDEVSDEAENYFIDTLLSWGPTTILHEFIGLYKHQMKFDQSFAKTLHSAEESLVYRNKQSAVGFLNAQGTHQDHLTADASTNSGEYTGLEDPKDALYVIDEVLDAIVESKSKSDQSPLVAFKSSRVLHRSLAVISAMKGNYDTALKHFMEVGNLDPTRSLEDIKLAALQWIAGKTDHGSRNNSYAFVLMFIEKHHLHQSLLDKNFLADKTPPLQAISRLVGLDLLGQFLCEHCVAPQLETISGRSVADKTGGERRGTLPIDMVAEQLKSNTELLLWYYHLLTVEKPELFVKFPNTANPPESIVILHSEALRLYIKHSGKFKDSSVALQGVEAYRVVDTSTPLLSFLKLVLPLGGINPNEVIRLLDAERKGQQNADRIFALELAYVKGHYFEQTEDEVMEIMQSYLKGAKSVMLAVSYAQRTPKYRKKLWNILMEYCLTDRNINDVHSSKGDLFGSLLEAAALSGADLAKLVKQIPPGMAIEGLRPRLVSAVADYRLKLMMHKTSSQIASAEKVSLLREVALRSRRGIPYLQPLPVQLQPTTTVRNDDKDTIRKPIELQHRLTKDRRINGHFLSMPLR